MLPPSSLARLGSSKPGGLVATRTDSPSPRREACSASACTLEMAMTSTFVENYETEQPILELARFMNLSQQKAAGHDADMGDSELYQV
jgi:hypothetical protein